MYIISLQLSKCMVNVILTAKSIIYEMPLVEIFTYADEIFKSVRKINIT